MMYMEKLVKEFHIAATLHSTTESTTSTPSDWEIYRRTGRLIEEHEDLYSGERYMIVSRHLDTEEKKRLATKWTVEVRSS